MSPQKHRVPEFRIELARAWTDEVDAIVRQGTGASPFQTAGWLSAWYRSLGARSDISALIAIVSFADCSRPAAVLPLAIQGRGRSRTITFADFDVTDYNAPILLTSESLEAGQAQAMWHALLAALAREGAVLRLDKMPAAIGGRPNPLAAIPGATSSEAQGNVVRIDGSWDAYHRGLQKKVRKELERSWRVFQRSGPSARFLRASTQAQAHHVLDAIEALQRSRIATLGLPYVLDDSSCAQLYRILIDEGLDEGFTVVTALVSDAGDVIAGLIGIRHAKTYAMLRLGRAEDGWTQCAPGRLVIDQTMQQLHGEGLDTFDFTIGDYAYKRAFGCEAVPLYQVVGALTMAGRLTLGGTRLAAGVKERLRSSGPLFSTLKQGYQAGRRLGRSMKSLTGR